MASRVSALKFVFVLLSSFAVVDQIAVAGDPDILTDFVSPSTSNVDGTFFTFTGIRAVLGSPFPTNFTVTKASAKEFPALIGQSVSLAVLQYPADRRHQPSPHPFSLCRASIPHRWYPASWFLDTTNKLFNQTLQAGDKFAFPKGLVHFQYNADTQNPAVAISAFGSANPGLVSISVTVFGTGIDDDIPAKSFKTDVATVDAFKAALTPPNN